MRRGATALAVSAIGIVLACGGDDAGRTTPADDSIHGAVGDTLGQAASDVGEALTQATRDVTEHAESALDAAVERAETAADSAAQVANDASAEARHSAANALDEMADRIRP